MPERPPSSPPTEEGVGSAPLISAPGGPVPSSLFVNSGSLLAARAYGIGVTGLFAIYAIRTLPLEEYGRYSVALALVTTFLLFSEMGIGSLAIREMSQHPERQARTLGTALAAECLTSLAAIAVMGPVALALDYPDAVLWLIAIGAGTIVLQSVLSPLESGFRARRVPHGALMTAWQATITAAVGVALVAAGGGAVALMAALLAGAAAAVPFALWLLRRRVRLSPSFAEALGRMLPFLVAAAPIAAAGVVWALYERIDVLMMSKLAELEEVAIYSVPLTILQYTLLVPAVIGTTFFPILTTTMHDRAAAGRAPFVLLARVFTLLGGSVAIGLAAGGSELMGFVFGPRYAESGQPMAILAAAVVLGFLNLLCWYTLLAGHRERAMISVIVGALLVKVALNAVLIPPLGASGAALAFVLGEVVLVGAELELIRRFLFPVPLGRILGRPVLAASAAGAAALALAPVSGVLAAAVATLLFAVALLLLRYISAAEWEPLTAPLRRGAKRLAVTGPRARP